MNTSWLNASNVLVGAVVLLAVAFIARKVWASVQLARNAKAGCTDCGCATTTSAKTDWSKT